MQPIINMSNAPPALPIVDRPLNIDAVTSATPSNVYDNKTFQDPPEWREITSEFFDAIKELSLGELMRHEVFGLFEAMSAIEMMDPKMDAGMCCNKNTLPLTYEAAVATNQLKLTSFDYSELIGIMDGIYSCLVSWLDGHSLAQTVFTCLYFHDPYSIDDKSLRVFCIGMYKLIEIIRKFIEYAKIFEEEDFEPRDYNYFLNPDVTNSRICCMIKEAEDELVKKTKNTSAENVEDVQAIISRLKFLRLYLQSLIALWPKNSVIPNEAEFTEIQRFLSGASDLMPTIKKTMLKGTQPELNKDAPNPMGFSPMVNQRILPPTFPRYTKIKDRSLSLDFLENLVHRTKFACRIVTCNNYHIALNFFMDFSKKSAPCLLSRSVLQTLYFPQTNTVFGTTSITDMLKESARVFISPPVLIPRTAISANLQAKSCSDAFFQYCTNMYTFVMFIQVCGYNRARQRDKLARLLDDFVNLQDEADRVDRYIHALNIDGVKETKPYFSTWILYYCLRAMSMYLLSGLELELYSLHEYIYIFWYLSEYLYSWIVSTLTRAECLVDQQLQNPSKQKRQKTKKKKMKIYCREIMCFQAIKNMFSGYFKALVGFIKEERIPQPLPLFDNERVRFEHRFAPFANLATPPPVSYLEFKNMTLYLMNNNVLDLYVDAGKHFHRARTMLETVPNPDNEINDMIRVSKINYVVMNLLAKGHKKGSKTAPEFDFSIHRYFPTIKQQ